MGLSAPACSFRQQTPNCHEVVGRNGLRRSTGESLAVAAYEKTLWGLRCLRAVLSLSVLGKIPAITGEILCRGVKTVCRKEVKWIINLHNDISGSFYNTEAGKPLFYSHLIYLVWSWKWVYVYVSFVANVSKWASHCCNVVSKYCPAVNYNKIW